MYPEDLRYTKDHEWIGPDGKIGITAHAAEQLGDITYVELPEVGANATQGSAVATIESVKAASDIYAPATGTVAAVNEALEGEPELINQSPHEGGWILKIEGFDSAQLDALMDVAAYEAHLKELEE